MMAFQIKPRNRGYDELFDDMVGNVPPGTFYDFSRPIVMWSRDPQGFILTTDNPSYPVRITRERLGDFDLGVDEGSLISETTVVPRPGELQTLFYITLGRGKNRLTAREILPGGFGRSQVLEVVATTTTLLYEGMGREIFRTSNKIDQQRDALYSKYSTRLLDQLAGVGPVLPDLQTLKILSTKLLIRSFVHFPATQLGVRNELEAVTLNTPIFVRQRGSADFQVETSQVLRAIQNIAGSEAHIWFPNLSVTRWLAYLRMANNFRNNFKIISVKDDVIAVEYKGNLRYHYFDYDSFGQNFLTNLTFNNCFRDFEVSAAIQFLLGIKICMWSYPFDMDVTALTPIGLTRQFLDSGLPFDSGVPFDADPVDPFSDGFVGWSYSGRFEMDPVAHPLDSMVQPLLSYTGPQCSYEGPYTQLLNSDRSDTEIDYLITASGDMDTYVAGPIVALGIDFDNSNVGVELGGTTFVAGVPILLCVKYVDSNGMANLAGNGIIRILEPISGVDEFAPVAAGFVYIYLTPTLAVPSTTFDLSDGTYTGQSYPITIIAADFAGFILSTIGPQVAGVPFSVTLQAIDAYGNSVTDVGLDTIVQITPQGGIDPADPIPTNGMIVSGQLTLNLTCNQPGTGELKFTLGATSITSNTFTVT